MYLFKNFIYKLQINAHDLLIEMGRYTKSKKTPIENRLCRFCKSNNIEDEPHFILHCPFTVISEMPFNHDNIFYYTSVC